MIVNHFSWEFSFEFAVVKFKSGSKPTSGFYVTATCDRFPDLEFSVFVADELLLDHDLKIIMYEIGKRAIKQFNNALSRE